MEKIILFDLDGTLIDSTEAIVKTFYFTFEKMNFKFNGTYNDIAQLIGYPLDIMYKELGIKETLIDTFVNNYRERYREISVDLTTLLPDALEAVKLASTFARLGVVTTKTARYSVPILENMQVMKYFECIIGREDVDNPKPHPEPILNAMKLMNITNKSYDIYMVGDTKLDLIAAQNAQINGVGVLCGHGLFEELSAYSNIIESNSLSAVKRIQSEKK